VHRARFPLCSPIAVDGTPTALQGLHNLHHGAATVIQALGTGRLRLRCPLGPAVIAAFPFGPSHPGGWPCLAICVRNLGSATEDARPEAPPPRH